MIRVIDDVLPDPHAYRARALAQDFRDVTIGPDTFRGIAPCADLDVTTAALEATGAEPVLTFFRKSPHGQIEPNYVHTDKDMGAFTGIYYMNPDPPPGDGTKFWDWDDGEGWRETARVDARFNRLLLFSTDQHHSRAIYNNYGEGDSARLIQVVFLR
jgi:hypothetical protein